MRLRYEFIIQEVAGNFMAVAIGEGAEKFKGMIRLNVTAKRIFELVQQGLDEDAIVEQLQQEYEAPESELRNAVDTLVGNLKDAKLLD